jgi:hypothetical protein
VFSRQLGDTVEIEGTGQVGFRVRGAFRAVEHVVGAVVYEQNLPFCARPGQVIAPFHVHGQRGGGLFLAKRHVVKRGGIEHRIGTMAFEHAPDRFGIADLDIRVGEARRLQILERFREVGSQLPVASDNADRFRHDVSFLLCGFRLPDLETSPQLSTG